MNTPIHRNRFEKQHCVASSLEIPILDGDFSAQESREPLLQLLFDLQKYHRKRNFSHQERFGKPDPWSEKVLINMTQAITNARQMIDDAQHHNRPLAFESSVKIVLSL